MRAIVARLGNPTGKAIRLMLCLVAVACARRAEPGRSEPGRSEPGRSEPGLSKHSAAACSPCQFGARSDAARASHLAHLWQDVTPPDDPLSGAELTQCLCFGVGPSVMTEDGNAYLVSDWGDAENVARAAHLAMHRRLPPWPITPERNCDQRVEHALAAEVDAHFIELSAREQLGIRPGRYPFETDFRALPSSERRSWLGDYLRAPAASDTSLPRLLDEYAQRCRNELAPGAQR